MAASSQALTSQSEDGESLPGEEEMREAEEKWVKGARQCRGEGRCLNKRLKGDLCGS